MKIYSIIPVYNVEPYLIEFLSSLQNQDCDNITYILINDGSTDKSGSICKTYAESDNRFILIEQENQGVSAARNAGLDYVEKLAKSDDYILFFDPDDYLTSRDAISQINEILTTSTPEILIYNHFTNDRLNQNNILKDCVIRGDSIGSILYPWMLFGAKHEGTVLSSSLFRSAFSVEVIKTNHLRFRTDIRKAEDTLFYAKYLTLINYAKLSTITPYNYRIRPLSLTTTFRKPSRLGIEKGISILSEFHQSAIGCPGISIATVDDYFTTRYINLIINYVVGITNKSSNLSRREIRLAINDLYANPELKRQIVEINPFFGKNLLHRMQSFIVRKRLGLIAYGKLFNILKNIKYRLR